MKKHTEESHLMKQMILVIIVQSNKSHYTPCPSTPNSNSPAAKKM